jgi:hypothetical protein
VLVTTQFRNKPNSSEYVKINFSNLAFEEYDSSKTAVNVFKDDDIDNEIDTTLMCLVCKIEQNQMGRLLTCSQQLVHLIFLLAEVKNYNSIHHILH